MVVLALALAALVVPGGPTAEAAVAGCPAPALRLVVGTAAAAYGPGVRIVIGARATNVSAAPCGLAVGATAPSIQIVGPTGRVVWRDCWAAGSPQPCPTVLVERVLRPGASLTAHAAWDQLIGPATRAATGPYRVSMRWGPGAPATTTVRLVAASTRSLRLGLADGGGWYALVVGGRLAVTLEGSAVYRWTVPASSRPDLLGVVAGSSGSTATGTLVARSPGTAIVTATGTPACYPQCLLPSRLFRVTVTVVRQVAPLVTR